MSIRKKAQTFLIFALVLLVFVLLNTTGFSDKISNSFFGLTASIQQSLWQAGDNVSGFFSGIFNAGNFEKRAEELESENKELKAEIAALLEFKKENTELREALNLSLEKEFSLELAFVVSKDISEDSLLINRGGEDGISEGFPVINARKVLLGKVGNVFDDFSEVILTTNKDNSFDAKVMGKEFFGVARGEGSLSLSLDFIPKEEEIIEGDIVVTTTLGGIYPSGLLVGEVKEVRNSDVETFQEVKVSPSFDLGTLESVFIIKEF